MGDQYHYYNSTNDSILLAVSVHLGDIETGIAKQIRKLATGKLW